MTIPDAKRIIKSTLDASAVAYTKLTAKTVDFGDLARDGKLFVTVHGWTPNPFADDLKKLARQHGFVVNFRGAGIL